MLTWLQPIWLIAAGAAVLVPLVAHLLSQQGGIPVTFPTIRFLKQVVDEGRRRVRLRHWLLLLLRCLAVALLAAAFARPLWSTSLAIEGPAQGIDARILLDRSASMSRLQDGRTLFETAKARALDALRTLDPSRDVAIVIVLDEQPRSLLPEPTANLSQLIRLVEALEPGYEHGDVNAALRLLAHGLSNTIPNASDSGPARTHRVLIFSDLQASQWPQASSIRAAIAGTPNVTIESLATPSENVALHRPTVSPVRPVVRQPAQVRVELSRWSQGPREPQTVTVRLRHEGRTHVQVIRMPANTTATATFTIVPAKPGPAFVELTASSEGIDDPMSADDSAGLVLDVAASRPVAVVSAADANDPATATYYVMRGLSPQAKEEGVPAVSTITAERWSPAELPAKLAGLENDASPVEFIVLTEAGAISEDSLAALRAYAVQGGGVLWFVDSPQAFAAWKRWSVMLDPTEGESTKKAQWLAGAEGKLANGRFSEPILDVFTSASRSELLSARFTSILRTYERDDHALLGFEGGDPALWATWLGAGRVAIFGASIAPANSDLVKGSQFVPLLHQLVYHLSPGPPAPSASKPGEPVRIAVAKQTSTADVIGKAPDGRSLDITWDSVAGRRYAVLPAAKEAGVYSLIRSSAPEADKLVGGSAVSIDPDESDLRVHDERSAAAASLAPTLSAAGSALLRPHKVELWPYFIAAAAALLLLESLIVSLNPAWLSRFISRREATGGAS